MKRPFPFCVLLTTILMGTCSAVNSLGQTERDSHDVIDLNHSKAARALLEKKLGRARTLSDLEKWAMEMVNNADKTSISDEERKKLREWAQNQKNDPKAHEAMKKLLENPPPELKANIEQRFDETKREEMKKLLETIKAEQNANNQGQQPPNGNNQNNQGNQVRQPPVNDQGRIAPPPVPPQPPVTAQDENNESKRRFSKESAKVAEKLLGKNGKLDENSELRKALVKMGKPSSTKLDSDKSGKLPKFASLFKFENPPVKANASKPKSLNFFNRFRLPSVGSAKVGSPSVGGSATGSLGFFGFLLIIVAFGAIVGVLMWLMRSWQSGLAGAKARGPQLGPWPIDPRQITTRQQLVQAFEYLAVLWLGMPAKNNNHRDIGASLEAGHSRNSNERRQAIDTLTNLYEEARYTPTDAPLSQAKMAAARRELSLLIGETPA